MLFTFFTAVSLVHASELPSDAKSLLIKRHHAVEKIDQKLTQELEKLKVSYTKRGDLDSANAIVLLMAKVDSKDGGSLAGKLSMEDYLVGTTWTWYKREKITLLANGKARWSHNGKEVFTWSVLSQTSRTISGKTSTGNRYRIAFNESFDKGKINESGKDRATYKSATSR